MCNLLWIMSYAHRRQIFKKFLYPLDRSLLIGIFFVCRQQFWLWKTSKQTSSDIKLNEFNQKNILRTCENSEYDRRPPSSIIGASKRQNLCLHFTIWTEKGLHKPVCHTVVWSLLLFYKAPVCYFLCNQRKKKYSQYMCDWKVFSHFSSPRRWTNFNLKIFNHFKDISWP